MWKYRLIPAAVLALLASGCGPELLGGHQGEVRAEATSEEEGQTSQAPASSPTYSPALTETAAELRGVISLTASVYIVAGDGSVIPLSSEGSGRFRIEGADETLIGRADVPARTYTAVRVEFSSVAAEVEGGLLVDGLPLLGPVTVQIGAGNSVAIERQLRFDLEARTSQTIVVDLNAHQWLPFTSLPSRLVSADRFRSAVEIRLR